MWIYSINIRMNTNDSLVEIAKKKSMLRRLLNTNHLGTPIDP